MELRMIYVLVFCSTIAALQAQVCLLRCAPGHACAFVRQEFGPPYPDCLSFREARLLDSALHGGATGPGTGFYPRRHRGFSPGAFPGFIQGPSGQNIVDDGSRNITININVQNTNVNQHASSGAGGSQVNAGAVPVGGVPLGSVSVGGVPLGSVPVRGVPLGSVPVGGVPLGTIQVGGVPLG